MLILRRIPQKNDCTQGAAEASKMHFCKLLKIRCRFLQKIQGTYFKISALYFKIYGLYFLQDALCFLERPERGEKHGVILENKKALTPLNIISIFFFFRMLSKRGVLCTFAPDKYNLNNKDKFYDNKII